MLRRVHIRGFKTAIDAVLDLGRLNVFVGPNGAGKSNLLEAIAVLGCAASGRVDYDAFRARGIRPGKPGLLKTALSSEKRAARTILLEAVSDSTRYQVVLGDSALGRGASTGSAAWRFDKETFSEGEQEVGSRSKGEGYLVHADGARQAITARLDRGIAPLVGTTRGEGEMSSLLRALEEFAIYAPLPPMLRAQIPDPAQKQPVGLMGGGLAEALLELKQAGAKNAALLRRIEQELKELGGWVERVSFEPESGYPGVPTGAGRSLDPHLGLRLQDRYLRSEVGWLSAVEANEGTLHVLFLLTMLYHPTTPQVLAIDNVDQSLNPQLARYLLARVQALVLAEPKRPQLLVTTHNPLALDALDLKDDRVRLFIVSRDKRTGATSVERMHHTDALERAKEHNMTLSRLWLSGALGGMPGV
ncbi:chromosome segregation protein SMC [Sorangium cellulosum]|uniref:Chromosome segregation protein SMC n=1 Tax=Sorangium cellulosum TaxID=56 RepID=A0A2L0EMN7_SORCE|nr:ATP-binding protein [Sorangium cellulosum]AUX40567.1 chromosome segregation protein SMC [Sorangium cellulosum]